MTREQATQALRAGKSVELSTLDATSTVPSHHAVWLDDDGDIVRSHPTRDVGTILVRDEDLDSLQIA